ncbi:MAG: 6-carboxytetrahydropterin synthase [Candidatus Thiodiazotropha sp. (ex Lucinoma borealis)]|nr:6-carboxytetrahydropterin synthase [Candidatus Thiodiazotropha sp. (ex Lucinoma borealis)]
MQCLECGTELEHLDNQHLLGCCSLTLHEYAIRHHLPLDLLVKREHLNQVDLAADYPSPQRGMSERARAVLRGLKWGGVMEKEGAFVIIPGEIRRLDQLLWDLQWLREYGFRFRQEYRYSDTTHRVVAKNRLKAPVENLAQHADMRLSPVPPPDFVLSLAVLIAHVGELQGGYLFLQFPEQSAGEAVAIEASVHGIMFKELDAADHPNGQLLRTLTRADTDRLLTLVSEPLSEMPGALDRFRQQTPEVTVSKELVFDAAHFITDHPSKCSNLHGGRYLLQVKVKDRVDPSTGCVVDYGYLKRVTAKQVIDRFDHHNLNYTTAELAWRSSTEMLCVYIWEQLIDYLPAMVELQLYETTQSWCNYSGPTLETYQQTGSDGLMTHFINRKLGESHLRNLIQEKPPTLEVVAKSQR